MTFSFYLTREAISIDKALSILKINALLDKCTLKTLVEIILQIFISRKHHLIWLFLRPNNISHSNPRQIELDFLPMICILQNYQLCLHKCTYFNLQSEGKKIQVPIRNGLAKGKFSIDKDIVGVKTKMISVKHYHKHYFFFGGYKFDCFISCPKAGLFCISLMQMK